MNDEKLDSSTAKADAKEGFYMGPPADDHLNKWPSEEDVPSLKTTMEAYYKQVLSAGSKLLSLLAMALNLDEDFFENIGALKEPLAFIRLIHYPGEVDPSLKETFGASAHSDSGMITLLMTDGVPGLQVCRDKTREPQVWSKRKKTNTNLYCASRYKNNILTPIIFRL